MITKEMQYSREIKREDKKPKSFTNVERVSVTEWDNEIENKDKTITHFSTYNLSMSYKDENGEYHRGNSFSLRDLIILRVAIDRAINKNCDEKEKEKK